MFRALHGRSRAKHIANGTADQLGLQATLLVTLIYSVRRHERRCRRPCKQREDLRKRVVSCML